jgi:hypothetical protein
LRWQRLVLLHAKGCNKKKEEVKCDHERIVPRCKCQKARASIAQFCEEVKKNKSFLPPWARDSWIPHMLKCTTTSCVRCKVPRADLKRVQKRIEIYIDKFTARLQGDQEQKMQEQKREKGRKKEQEKREEMDRLERERERAQAQEQSAKRRRIESDHNDGSSSSSSSSSGSCKVPTIERQESMTLSLDEDEVALLQKQIINSEVCLEDLMPDRVLEKIIVEKGGAIVGGASTRARLFTLLRLASEKYLLSMVDGALRFAKCRQHDDSSRDCRSNVEGAEKEKEGEGESDDAGDDRPPFTRRDLLAYFLRFPGTDRFGRACSHC